MNMYLHLGQDTVVLLEDIIGIFDLENTSISKFTKMYLARAERAGRVVNVCTELPKSFIVCVRRRKATVYISQISSQTLKKRTGFLQGISNLP